MGYVFAHGSCIRCQNFFSFNPNKVVSVRVNGVKEPLCHPCAEWVVAERTKMGIPVIDIPVDAYEPLDENELY